MEPKQDPQGQPSLMVWSMPIACLTNGVSHSPSVLVPQEGFPGAGLGLPGQCAEKPERASLGAQCRAFNPHKPNPSFLSEVSVKPLCCGEIRRFVGTYALSTIAPSLEAHEGLCRERPWQGRKPSIPESLGKI